MADIIKCNTGTLKTDSQSVEKYVKDIKKEIGEMKADVKTMNSMWDGAANDAFNKAFNSDIDELYDLCDKIMSIYYYEENAVSEYNKCEKKVADLVSAINV